MSWGPGRCDEKVPENHPWRLGCLEGVVSGERVRRAPAASRGNSTLAFPQSRAGGCAGAGVCLVAL